MNPRAIAALAMCGCLSTARLGPGVSTQTNGPISGGLSATLGSGISVGGKDAGLAVIGTAIGGVDARSGELTGQILGGLELIDERHHFRASLAGGAGGVNHGDAFGVARASAGLMHRLGAPAIDGKTQRYVNVVYDVFAGVAFPAGDYDHDAGVIVGVSVSLGVDFLTDWDLNLPY